MKDYKEILQKYKFTDELGHPLENCQDYLDLLAETREAVRAEREACAEIALKLIPDAADFDEIKTERAKELVLHGANIANAIKDRILRRNTKAV